MFKGLLLLILTTVGAAAEAADLIGAVEANQAISKKEVMVDAQGRRITVVNFEDALIEGQARAPDGFVLKSRQGSALKNILDLRRDFRLQLRGDAAAASVVVGTPP